MVYQTSDFRNGIKVLIDSQPYVMTYFQFVKPGKGTAFTRTKLKNLITGNVIERTFRTGETLEAADCEDVNMQYQWLDGDMYNFMNMETFETVGIPIEIMSGTELYLLDNLECTVTMFEGRPVGLVLPNFIEAEITYCEPGVRGNTAQGATKPATIAPGATVQVPLFVDQGEIIKVDTRDGSYVGRVTK
ncbi:MAG: elongation factor P [Alphaproteobacteria bacterium]|nr:elongation factor P [Alphaproteobacteria bacterium]